MEKRLKIQAGLNGVALVAASVYVLFALLYIFPIRLRMFVTDKCVVFNPSCHIFPLLSF